MRGVPFVSRRSFPSLDAILPGMNVLAFLADVWPLLTSFVLGLRQRFTLFRTKS